MNSEARNRLPFIPLALAFFLGTFVGFLGGIVAFFAFESFPYLLEPGVSAELAASIVQGHVGDAYAMYENGDISGAISRASIALIVDPVAYSPHLALGEFYESVGADELAIDELKRALELVENSAEIGAEHDRKIIEEKLEALTN